jgi:hypothetical protein
MSPTPESRPSWRDDLQSLKDFRALVMPLLAGVREPPIVTLTLHGGSRTRQVHIYPWSEPFANEIRQRLAGLDIAVVEGRAPRIGSIKWPDTESDPHPPFNIPGVAQALLFRDGFWDRMNNELHTAFDEFEEEPIPPDVAERMQPFIRQYLDAYVRDHPDEMEVPSALSAFADYLAASSTARATLWTAF